MSDMSAADSPHFSTDADPAGEEVQGWTEVETGRFMPRRTRGSCQGRALG